MGDNGLHGYGDHAGRVSHTAMHHRSLGAVQLKAKQDEFRAEFFEQIDPIVALAVNAAAEYDEIFKMFGDGKPLGGVFADRTEEVEADTKSPYLHRAIKHITHQQPDHDADGIRDSFYWYQDKMGNQPFVTILSQVDQMMEMPELMKNFGPRMPFEGVKMIADHYKHDPIFKKQLLEDLKNGNYEGMDITAEQAVKMASEALNAYEETLGQLKELAPSFVEKYHDEVDTLFPEQSRCAGK